MTGVQTYIMANRLKMNSSIKRLRFSDREHKQDLSTDYFQETSAFPRGNFKRVTMKRCAQAFGNQGQMETNTDFRKEKNKPKAESITQAQDSRMLIKTSIYNHR